MIFNKKRSFFEKKLSESIAKLKDLWKALKFLQLPNETSSCEFSAFKRNNTVEHDANSVLEGFKKYYSTLADTLGTLVTFNFGRLPKAPNKYSIDTVIKYYKHVIQGSHFDLASVSENPILFKINSSFKSSWS